jgi:hypothetical protein
MRIKKNGQIITLTESDLKRIVKKVQLSEQVMPQEDKDLQACVRKIVGKDNETRVVKILQGEWDAMEVTKLMVSLFDPFTAADKASALAKCHKDYEKSGGNPNVAY